MMTRRYPPTRRTALGLIGAGLALPRAALADGVETTSGTAFGTGWRIAARQGVGLAGLAPGIVTLFERIDAAFSPWRADSALSRFNAGPAGVMAVSPDLAWVAAAALGIARKSQGAFDPTVGPLVARWGFGPIVAGGAPDWRGIATEPGGLGKSRDGLTLDLCGIAKGWALDEAARLVRSAGVRDALLELGGELVALGGHPRGRDWRVVVEAPLAGWSPPANLRLPGGAAAATSGLRAQGYIAGGRIYGHIIDAGARAPVTGRLRSVTVVSESAMAADGWATALFAAGDEAGPDLAQTHEIAALFLLEKEGELDGFLTGSMSEFIL